MKPGGKLIMANGISGCGRKEVYESWQAYCESRGKKVKIFNAGYRMLEFANEDLGLDLQPENIHNADQRLRHVLRSVVFKEIIADISGNDYDAVIISVHGFFPWQNVFKRAFDRFFCRFLKQFPPDLFVTFIDDFRRIKSRLSERPQWRKEAPTHAEILVWQNIEVETAGGWSDFAEKPLFVIGVAEPASTLYKLVFHPEIEPVYIAMPISHFREPQDREKIDQFIKRLSKYFAVFNPLSVEIVGAASVDDVFKRERQTIHDHVVHRDINWFVHQSKKVIVFWPGPVPSPGLSTESYAAFTQTKDVWVVYLGQEASPFITHVNTGFTRSEDEFFAFLDARYPERKDLVW